MPHLLKASFLSLAIFVLGAAKVSAEEKFRVGVIAPLSGALAEYGRAAQNGIELARSQHHSLFTNIEFIYEDSQWDAKTAVSAFTKLRDTSKVSLIFNWGNPTTEAVAPLAERSKLPLIGMSLDPSVSQGKSFVIRLTNSSSDFSGLLGRYLVHQGYKNLGVVMAENTYVRGFYEGLRDSIGASARIEVVDTYNIQDQDFRSSIAKLRAKRYDAIGVFLISGQVSNFYRQLSAQSISLPSFGTDFFESTSEIKLARGEMSGAVYTHLGVSDKFRDSYISRFGNDYQLAYAGNAYDAALVIGKFFNSNQNATNEEIMSRLRSVSDEPGVGGKFSYSDEPGNDPHFRYPVQLKRIEGEKIIPLPIQKD